MEAQQKVVGEAEVRPRLPTDCWLIPCFPGLGEWVQSSPGAVEGQVWGSQGGEYDLCWTYKVLTLTSLPSRCRWWSKTRSRGRRSGWSWRPSTRLYRTWSSQKGRSCSRLSSATLPFVLQGTDLDRRALLAQAEGAEGEAKKLALQVPQLCIWWNCTWIFTWISSFLRTVGFWATRTTRRKYNAWSRLSRRMWAWSLRWGQTELPSNYLDICWPPDHLTTRPPHHLTSRLPGWPRSFTSARDSSPGRKRGSWRLR